MLNFTGKSGEGSVLKEQGELREKHEKKMAYSEIFESFTWFS